MNLWLSFFTGYVLTIVLFTSGMLHDHADLIKNVRCLEVIQRMCITEYFAIGCLNQLTTLYRLARPFVVCLLIRQFTVILSLFSGITELSTYLLWLFVILLLLFENFCCIFMF